MCVTFLSQFHKYMLNSYRGYTIGGFVVYDEVSSKSVVTTALYTCASPP